MLTAVTSPIAAPDSRTAARAATAAGDPPSFPLVGRRSCLHVPAVREFTANFRQKSIDGLCISPCALGPTSVSRLTRSRSTEKVNADEALLPLSTPRRWRTAVGDRRVRSVHDVEQRRRGEELDTRSSFPCG